MREKSDLNEKHLKQTAPNCDDYSLEWRQYCLDTVCTNFNQIICDMAGSGGSVGGGCSHQPSMVNSQNNYHHQQQPQQFSAIKLSQSLSSSRPNATTFNAASIDIDGGSKKSIVGSQSLLSSNTVSSLFLPSSPSGYISGSDARISGRF